MKYSEYKYLICSDLYRITGQIRFPLFLRYVLFHDTYPYVFWMRTCRYAGAVPLLRYTVYPIAKLVLHHLRFKLGIRIQPETSIGSGLNIGHFGGINVHARCVIGRNCDISQQVTLGQANRGKNKGYPTLGDNVYVGPGARIIGRVRIGNNVAIGANCVVTKDVPDNSVVVGIPGHVISQKGSAGYIDRTDYDGKIG